MTIAMNDIRSSHSSILNELHFRMEALPRALSRIARYILTNPEKVIRLSLADVAQHSQSGQASVLRLIRDLGFDGFADFRLHLTAELARLPQVPNGKTDIVHLVAGSVSNMAIADLQATEKLLAGSPVLEVADRIRVSDRIHIFGSGLSGLAGEVLNYRLVRLGFNSQAFRDPTLAHELSGTLGENTVAVAISDSGMSPPTVDFLTMAKAAGAFTVAISSRLESALADRADALLRTGSTGGADKAGCISGVLVRSACVIEVLGQLLEKKNVSSLKS